MMITAGTSARSRALRRLALPERRSVADVNRFSGGKTVDLTAEKVMRDAATFRMKVPLWDDCAFPP